MAQLHGHELFRTPAFSCDPVWTSHDLTWTSPYPVATEIRKITLFAGTDYNNVVDLGVWAYNAQSKPVFFWAWDHFANPTKSASWEIDFGSPGYALGPSETLYLSYATEDYGMLPDKLGVKGLTRATFTSYIYIVVP